MISESAKSKIILIGEHAVVHGSRAIAMPHNAFCKVAIKQQKNKGISFKNAQNLSFRHEQALLQIVEHVLNYLGEKDISLEISVECEIEAGVGFGLSASLSIALTKALFRFFDREISQDELLQLIQELEDLNHGKSSGIDHSVIVYDQPILFQKGSEAELIPQINNEEIFKHLYLVNTGKPEESTKEMVAFVSEQLEREPGRIEQIFDEIDLLVPQILEICERGDFESFVDGINKAGVLLEDLGVVSKDVKIFSEELRTLGAGVKISGAGGRENGSGLCLVFCKDVNSLHELAKKYSFKLIS